MKQDKFPDVLKEDHQQNHRAFFRAFVAACLYLYTTHHFSWYVDFSTQSFPHPSMFWLWLFVGGVVLAWILLRLHQLFLSSTKLTAYKTEIRSIEAILKNRNWQHTKIREAIDAFLTRNKLSPEYKKSVYRYLLDEFQEALEAKYISVRAKDRSEEVRKAAKACKQQIDEKIEESLENHPLFVMKRKIASGLERAHASYQKILGQQASQYESLSWWGKINYSDPDNSSFTGAISKLETLQQEFEVNRP